MSVRVSWITIAPVKGLALLARDEVLLEESGVAENRRFHLIDEQGLLVNGKRLGTLVRVVADWDADADRLLLRLPNGNEVSAEVTLREAVTTVFYGRPVEGRLVEGPFDEALSEVAGEPLRLVRPDDSGAGVDRGSGAAATILGAASLERLAQAAGVTDVDPRRFRMLFGIEGVEAHEEDTWIGRRVTLGEAVVEPRGNVGRCAVTTHDPDSGVPDLGTLKALAAYRGVMETTEPLPFGIVGRVVTPGRVQLGDPVSVA